MNNSFQINDGLHLQALAPLPLVRYKELFCNHQHEIILNYYKHYFDKMDLKIYQPYFILGVIPKIAAFTMNPGKSITIDLSSDINKGQILYFETSSKYSKEVSQTELILNHGNSPFNHYLIPSTFSFYCYPNSDNAYPFVPYELIFIYFTQEQYNDFALRQLANAIHSLQTGNFLDCVIKATLACENLLKRNLPEEERTKYELITLIDKLETNYIGLPIFPYIENLHQMRKMRNNIIHFEEEL